MSAPFAPAPLTLELLPGEVLHAECGASRKGFVVRLAQWLAVPALLIVMLGGFVLAPPLPAEDKPRASASATAEAAKTGASAAEQAAKSESRRAAFRAWNRSVFTWLGGGLLVMFLVGIADQWRAIGNARYWITSERVAIRSGGYNQSVMVLDLDRIIAVEARANWLEQRLGLVNIELKHAGFSLNPMALRFTRNDNVLMFLDSSGPILGQLVNHWLPRDGRARA